MISRDTVLMAGGDRYNSVLAEISACINERDSYAEQAKSLEQVIKDILNRPRSEETKWLWTDNAEAISQFSSKLHIACWRRDAAVRLLHELIKRYNESVERRTSWG